MNQTTLSLLELNSLVKRSLSQCLPDEYWVQAELSDVRAHANGHCYLEFVQKDPRSNGMVAKARGTIWANIFRLLKPYFEDSTGQPFVSGIKVLVKVVVEFHELYGYSLTVCDIDPAYTLGDMVQRRREILRQLEEEGVLTLNKELDMPELPQRVAVISSPTAAGYDDFSHQLNNNPHGYYFSAELFPAIMQGNQVEQSVLAALEKIMDREDEFDAVVIIRGGGATSDLSGFDTYLLAAACAQYPLPIITGIGHERDDTVLDAVAHTRVKTPTAAAEYLINKVDESAVHLKHLAVQLKKSVFSKIESEQVRLALIRNRMPSAAVRRVAEAKYELLALKQVLKQSAFSLLLRQKHKLELLQQRIVQASPELLLKRGYSITLKEGKAVTDPAQVKAGDVLVIKVNQGEIISIVQSKADK